MSARSLLAIVNPVFVFAVMLFLGSYYMMPDYRSDIKFVGISLASAAGIYSALAVGMALRAQIVSDRLARSFAILDKLGEVQHIATRRKLEETARASATGSPGDLYTQITSDSELFCSVTSLLGVLEDAAIAIRHRHVDEKLLFRSLCFIVASTCDRLRSYFNDERKLTGDARIYYELDALAASWKDGKLVTTGKPVPKD